MTIRMALAWGPSSRPRSGSSESGRRSPCCPWAWDWKPRSVGPSRSAWSGSRSCRTCDRAQADNRSHGTRSSSNSAKDAGLAVATALQEVTCTFTVAPAPVVRPPGSPQGITTSPGDEVISISWSAPVDDGGTPVTVYAARCRPVGTVDWGPPSDVVGTARATEVKPVTQWRDVRMPSPGSQLGGRRSVDTGAWDGRAVRSPTSARRADGRGR